METKIEIENSQEGVLLKLNMNVIEKPDHIKYFKRTSDDILANIHKLNMKEKNNKSF